MLEEIVDKILEKLQEMGFTEPVMRKRKQEVRSYKMDSLVHLAMIMIYKKKKSDGDSNGNAVEYSVLGFKTLETNVLELQFVICWQTMIKTQSLGLDLLKVCFNVKFGIE